MPPATQAILLLPPGLLIHLERLQRVGPKKAPRNTKSRVSKTTNTSIQRGFTWTGVVLWAETNS